MWLRVVPLTQTEPKQPVRLAVCETLLVGWRFDSSAAIFSMKRKSRKQGCLPTKNDIFSLSQQRACSLNDYYSSNVFIIIGISSINDL